jgi:hypothetical protein
MAFLKGSSPFPNFMLRDRVSAPIRNEAVELSGLGRLRLPLTKIIFRAGVIYYFDKHN